MLRELTEPTGLVADPSTPLMDSYKGLPVHAPGLVLTDVAVVVAADGAAASGIETLTDRQNVFGFVASVPTIWRVLDRVTGQRLPAMRGAYAEARAKAWAAGARPDLDHEDGGTLVIDVDPTISLTYSARENAGATWKRTLGALRSSGGEVAVEATADE